MDFNLTANQPCSILSFTHPVEMSDVYRLYSNYHRPVRVTEQTVLVRAVQDADCPPPTVSATPEPRRGSARGRCLVVARKCPPRWCGDESGRWPCRLGAARAARGDESATGCGAAAAAAAAGDHPRSPLAGGGTRPAPGSRRRRRRPGGLGDDRGRWLVGAARGRGGVVVPAAVEVENAGQRSSCRSRCTWTETSFYCCPQ